MKNEIFPNFLPPCSPSTLRTCLAAIRRCAPTLLTTKRCCEPTLSPLAAAQPPCCPYAIAHPASCHTPLQAHLATMRKNMPLRNNLAAIWHYTVCTHLARIHCINPTLLPFSAAQPPCCHTLAVDPLCCHTSIFTHFAAIHRCAPTFLLSAPTLHQPRRLETAFRTSKSRNRQARQASRFSSFISSITIGAILPKAQRPLAQHISTRTRRFHTHYTRHMHYTLYVHAPARAREGRLAIKKSGRGTMSYAPPRLTECRSSNRAPPNFPRQFSFFVIPFFPSSFQS